MSDVYIKGLGMPKDGEHPYWVTIHSDGMVEYDENKGQGWQTSESVPVPDHGRLIDADALEAHGDCLSKLHVDFDAPAGHQVWRECVPFDDIPTIIPAEEGE